MTHNPALNADHFNNMSKNHFPGLLGVNITHVEQGKMTAKMEVKKAFFAPNGFLHAGSIVTFADTVAGYASMAHLPENGKSFTTLELKSNFLKAARDGFIECECVAEHLGRTTHVWRVIVKHGTTGKKIAVFSCTQLVLY